MKAIFAVINRHYLSSGEIKAWKKNSGLYGIWTHDLFDTSAALYEGLKLYLGKKKIFHAKNNLLWSVYASDLPRARLLRAIRVLACEHVWRVPVLFFAPIS